MEASASMNELEDCPASDEELEKVFNEAATHVQSLAASLPQDRLLFLYARYKQSTEGPCNIPKPGFFDFKGRQKWDAWKGVGDMGKIEAMREYVKAVTETDPEWEPMGKNDKGGMTGVRVSTLQQKEEEVRDEDKSAFDWVKENDIEKLRNLGPETLSSTDENGMNLLHWAADRGYLAVTKCLLEQNIDIDSTDNENQTPLHYAASCGHVNIVKTLLECGADPNIKDSDGLQPEECAEEEAIRVLFKS